MFTGFHWNSLNTITSTDFFDRVPEIIEAILKRKFRVTIIENINQWFPETKIRYRKF
jgi:hypothetical protein